MLRSTHIVYKYQNCQTIFIGMITLELQIFLFVFNYDVYLKNYYRNRETLDRKNYQKLKQMKSNLLYVKVQKCTDVIVVKNRNRHTKAYTTVQTENEKIYHLSITKTFSKYINHRNMQIHKHIIMKLFTTQYHIKTDAKSIKTQGMSSDFLKKQAVPVPI